MSDRLGNDLSPVGRAAPHHTGHARATPGGDAGRGSLGAATVGLAGGIVALLAGGWLMLAPFALGYQPEGTGWTNATTTDFFTGLGLAILALLASIALLADLTSRLRAAGGLPPRRSPYPDPDSLRGTDSATPTGVAGGPADELVNLLRPLVDALNRDNPEHDRGGLSTNRSAIPTHTPEQS